MPAPGRVPKNIARRGKTWIRLLTWINVLLKLCIQLGNAVGPGARCKDVLRVCPFQSISGRPGYGLQVRGIRVISKSEWQGEAAGRRNWNTDSDTYAAI